MYIGIGNTNLRCGGTISYPPAEDKVFAVLDTLANGKYNTFPSLAQNPTNTNKVLLTYLEGVDHSYDATKIIRIRVSNDKGITWGSPSTIYDPGGVLCVIEQHSGYTNDGLFHVLLTNIDDATPGVCTLIYLYSDNNGTSFSSPLDITSLVSNVTRPVFRNSGNLIENNGVLMTGLYRQDSGATTSERMILRLVSGTWSATSIEITSVYENEMTMAVLGGNNLLLLVRQDLSPVFSFVQFQSSNNGVTWTRLGSTGNWGLPNPGGAWPSMLNSFYMNGERIIVHYFPRFGANYPHSPLYAVYARASDLITNGLTGWNNDTVRVIALAETGVYSYIVHGGCLHYNNNYNAIACWPHYPIAMDYGDLETFEIPSLDASFLQTTLWGGTYTGDTDALKFINNAGITDATQQTALQTLVAGLKTDSVWTKIKAAYPMVGGTATTHKFNLVNPFNTEKVFRLAFAGTWIHSATGAKPNGTDAYADTNIIPSTDLTLYSASLGYYSRTNVSETGIDIGAYQNGATNPGLMMRTRYTSGSGIFYNYNCYTGADMSVSAVNADSRGLTTGSRTANNVSKIFINGTQSGSTQTATAENVTSGYPIYIGSVNYANTAANFVTKECAFAFISAGLTDTDVANLYARIQAFETALSRQV